jgi:small subunit ribosomal protein S17
LPIHLIIMTESPKRNNRKELLGVVRSKTGNKSLKVVYEYKVPHPLYKKEIRRKTTVHAHDEKNDAGVGDRVRIMATRPLSKLKRWRVVSIVHRAPETTNI